MMVGYRGSSVGDIVGGKFCVGDGIGIGEKEYSFLEIEFRRNR